MNDFNAASLKAAIEALKRDAGKPFPETVYTDIVSPELYQKLQDPEFRRNYLGGLYMTAEDYEQIRNSKQHDRS